MDGDGSTSQNHLDYSTASARLAEEVRELVQSLGGTATLAVKQEPKFTHKGEVRIGLPSYRVSIALPNEVKPFRLARFGRGGEVIGLYLVLYSIARFIVEFFREHEQGLVGPFSLTQWISLALLAVGIAILLGGRQAIPVFARFGPRSLVA